MSVLFSFLRNLDDKLPMAPLYCYTIKYQIVRAYLTNIFEIFIFHYYYTKTADILPFGHTYRSKLP